MAEFILGYILGAATVIFIMALLGGTDSAR